MDLCGDSCCIEISFVDHKFKLDCADGRYRLKFVGGEKYLFLRKKWVA